MSAELNTISLSTRGQNQTAVGSARRADRVVTFGEVARECRETSRDTTVAKIVGLEHLDPEDLELKRFDEGGDNTFTKSFKKGQMLFGRRRAYLKKAALAPFDGICSGDITVIEAISERLDPHLLPFLVQNDAFFAYAVGGSAGSLSPRVKWEHLAAYTFSLPPLAEQKKLASALWAMERVKRAYKKLLAETDRLVEARFVEMFGDGKSESTTKFPLEQIGNLCEIKSGGTPNRKKNEYWINGTVPWVKTTELHNNLISETEESITEAGVAESAAKWVPKGTILMAMYGQGKTRGMTAMLDVPATTNQACACILPGTNIDQVFLWKFLILSYDRIRNLSHGASQQNLSTGIVKEIAIPLPPLSLQREFAAFVGRVEKAKESLKNALAALTAAQKARMNAAFRGEM